MFASVVVSSRGNAQVLVVGQFQGEALDRATARLDADGSMKEASKLAEATGDLGAIAEGRCWDAPYERVIVVGLGDKDGFNQENGPERLRTAMGAVGRRLARIKATSAQIELAGPLSTGRGKAGKVDAAVGGRAVGEAFGLLSWNYDELRGKATTVAKREKLSLKEVPSWEQIPPRAQSNDQCHQI